MRAQSFGGVSIDTQTGASLFAWEATPPGLTGLVMLNLVSNILYNNALNETGRAAAAAPSVILANYQTFPGIAAGTLVALKWNVFFGAAMVRNPSFLCPSISHLCYVISGCLPCVLCALCLE